MSTLYIDQREAWRLVRIFDVCGLPHKASINLMLRLQTWEKSRGMRWVTEHLKSLASDLIGARPEHDIAKHPNGSWAYELRPVYTMAKRSRRGFRNSLRVLRIYGRYYAKKPDLLDFQKFADSVNLRQDQSVPDILYTREDLWLANSSAKSARFNMVYDMSTTKSSPSQYKSKMAKRSMMNPEQHVHALDYCPSLVYRNYDFLASVVKLNDKEHYKFLRTYTRRPDKNVVGGVKALVKDRGLKLRFIANPCYILQVAMSRLKAALEDFLQSMPESCVYDQARGTRWIHEKLKDGYSISSIDLSKCSDNLPAREQFEMLRVLFGPELFADIRLFEDVSRGNWFTPYEDLYVRWTKGQPLGTGPSFACFTVFHILLIRTVGGSATDFRVIGDDVVLSSPELTTRVLQLYEDLGVSISVHKSLFNSWDLGEFAGRLVDRRGVLPIFKASPFDVAKDPLGYIRQYGMRGVKLLPLSLRPMLWAVACLPFPYGYGEDGVASSLPGELVYDLYTPSFKPQKMAKLTTAMQEYLSVLDYTSMHVVKQTEYGPLAMLPYVQTRLGEGAWVLPLYEGNQIAIQLLSDHVNSFTGTPLVELPEKVSVWEEWLSQHLIPTASSSEPLDDDSVDADDPKKEKKPISSVRKIFDKLVKAFRGDI